MAVSNKKQTRQQRPLCTPNTSESRQRRIILIGNDRYCLIQTTRFCFVPINMGRHHHIESIEQQAKIK